MSGETQGASRVIQSSKIVIKSIDTEIYAYSASMGVTLDIGPCEFAKVRVEGSNLFARSIFSLRNIYLQDCALKVNDGVLFQ